LNWNRIKFQNLQLANDIKIFTTDRNIDPYNYDSRYSNDPTLFDDIEITSGKALWINPNTSTLDSINMSNIGYIYIDEEYFTEHNIACGRTKDDSNNIIPSNNAYKGRWVPASSWILRDHETGNASMAFWNNIQANGEFNSSVWANRALAIAFSFSI